MGIDVQLSRQEKEDFLSLPNEEFLSCIEIINSSGNQIYMGELKMGNNEIKLPNLAKGLYMIIAWGNYCVKTENIIVN